MAYRIEATPGAARDLQAWSTKEQRRIGVRIEALGEDPRPQGCRKLRGREDFYRIRVGDYRVVYQIKDEKLVILIIRIGDRKEIFEIVRRL